MAENDGAAGAASKARELRFIFVQMLFALAVAEIARRIVLLADGASLSRGLPGYAHLLLALIVVASSWVGWANSRANQEWSLTRTWSLRFIILLVDVLLVVLYFVLVSRAEQPDKDGTVPASARGETGTLLWIFVVYAMWDFLTKAGRGNWTNYLKRTWITWGCVLLAFFVWLACSQAGERLSVILADILLILIVLAFRAFKDKTIDQSVSRLGLGLWGVTVIGLVAWTVCLR